MLSVSVLTLRLFPLETLCSEETITQVYSAIPVPLAKSKGGIGRATAGRSASPPSSPKGGSGAAMDLPPVGGRTRSLSDGRGGTSSAAGAPPLLRKATPFSVSPPGPKPAPPSPPGGAVAPPAILEPNGTTESMNRFKLTVSVDATGSGGSSASASGSGNAANGVPARPALLIYGSRSASPTDGDGSISILSPESDAKIAAAAAAAAAAQTVHPLPTLTAAMIPSLMCKIELGSEFAERLGYVVERAPQPIELRRRTSSSAATPVVQVDTPSKPSSFSA